MSLVWRSCTFEQLDNVALYQLLHLRAEAFIVEQACAYQDLDGKDLYPETYHLLGYQNNELVVYLRAMAPGIVDPVMPVIGRVITRQSHRGQGLGHQLIAQGVKLCSLLWPDRAVHLSAQAHLQGYYGQHGFLPAGEQYLEDGIPHIGMNKSA
ncbi:MAG: GNAT family N-acetyltransferase [Plesiomonas sp.]|uniref:GNAT family N-acetyltransferase n=1 Tax=Plesiomonas sp. TaxID=2486279 RepID=UPI003EE49333